MNHNTTETIDARRDRYQDACGLSIFVSLALIVGHVASPPLLDTAMPYSGGAAVVLGLGAMLGLALTSRHSRLAAAIAVLGLVTLRALAVVRPDLLVADHGAATTLDAVGLTIGWLAAALVTGTSFVRPPRHDESMLESMAHGRGV